MPVAISGETSKHTKNEIYTTKNKNVFQRWNQKAAPGHTLRTLKTSCKVFRGDVSVCVRPCVSPLPVGVGV